MQQGKVIQYKCPDCGGDMAFDAASGMLRCGMCGRLDTIEAQQTVEQMQYNTQDQMQYGTQNQGQYQYADQNMGGMQTQSMGGTQTQSMGGAQMQSMGGVQTQNQYSMQQQSDYRPSADHEHISTYTTEEDDMVQFQCQNCGAVVMTNKNTTATHCSFCGAPVILSDRLEGITKPDYVIPFKIPRREADEAFKKWTKRLRFAPKDFRMATKIKKVEGLYAPFWVYDVCGQGEATADCTRSKVYYRGDYRITETSHYEVYRAIDTTFNRIPADASDRMEDNLMDLMEPFDYNGLQPFTAQYLTGYVAENYDYDAEQMFPRVKTRVLDYMDQYVKNSITGYDTKVIVSKNYRTNRDKTNYCLFPIWMNYATYNGKDYSFAMNGETGKIAGKPPISGKIVASYIFGFSAVTFLIIRLLVYFSGGPFLW